MYKITISLPCYGRLHDTKMAIRSVVQQDIDGWELLAVGDCCPEFEKLINGPWFKDQVKQSAERGNSIKFYNRSYNSGAWGTRITNDNIQSAQGEYFIFLANDDYLAPNHLRNYLQGIERTKAFHYTYSFAGIKPGEHYDFVYFNSILPDGSTRNTQLKRGHIGHSEIIVRTNFLQSMPPHKPLFGHDWTLIQDMIKSGAKYKKCDTAPTYHVGHCSTPAQVRDLRKAGKHIQGWPVWKQFTEMFKNR